jgi:hypothetical protein
LDTVQQGNDWEVVIDPETRYLRAGGDCHIRARVAAPDPCAVNDGAPAQISIRGFYRLPDQTPRRLFGGATIFGRSTRDAAVTVNCEAGRSNYFSGQLLEAACLQQEQSYFRPLRRAREPIALELRSPTGRLVTQMTRTNENGVFADEFVANEAGRWQVVAHWIGDRAHPIVSSAPCLFEAECPPPAMTCPENTTLAAGAACTATFTEMASAASPCQLPVTITSDPALPLTVGLGTYPVTYTARDAAGNTATCTTTVTVADQTPPVITCPADVTMPVGEGCMVTFNGMATATDNCDAEVAIVSDPPLPANLPAGIRIITYTATDDAGNIATCTTTVTVVDNVAPVITCPDFTILTADENCMAVFNEPATAVDNCDMDVTITSDPPLPATFDEGEYTVTFTATDDAGNTAMCTVMVVVFNNSPVANAGPDQDLTVAGNVENVTVTLNGTGSSDADLHPVTYLWEQISGPPVTLNDPTSPMPSYTQLIDYQWREFRLTVTDPCGATATDTVRVRARYN